MYGTVSKKLIVAICFLVFSATLIFPQGHFEGKITFQVNEEGQKTNISYFVKGNKFRIQPIEDTKAAMGTMIYDATDKSMTILMNEQKMYMKMPIDISEEMSNNESTGKEYFINTGETKDVMGHTCYKFNFNDGDESGVAWMTKELGPFLFMGKPEEGGNTEYKWQKEIMEEGYFPMLVEQENSSGELETVFEITDLQSMNLDDSFFDIPPDFIKFDMPGMIDKNK